MNTAQSSVITEEIEKFKQFKNAWWDTDGPLKTLHDINPTRLSYIEKTVALTDLSILDVGCGGGILSIALSEKKANVVGLDAEAEGLKAGQQVAESRQLSVDFVHTSIENYHPCQLFDAIVCMEMLEHVDDFSMIIAHANRLLKPNGYLFLSTLNRTIKAYAFAILGAEYIFSLVPRHTHDYQKFIRPHELCQALRNYQFDVLDISGMSYQPLTRTASLSHNVDVNYFVTAQKRSES